MFNPVDTRQIRALVDHKRQQVAADAASVRRTVRPEPEPAPSIGPIRVAIGVRLIRVGAKIAGVYTHTEPHLRPGL
jgi:hypothetical protein